MQSYAFSAKQQKQREVLLQFNESAPRFFVSKMLLLPLVDSRFLPMEWAIFAILPLFSPGVRQRLEEQGTTAFIAPFSLMKAPRLREEPFPFKEKNQELLKKSEFLFAIVSRAFYLCSLNV